MKHWKFYNLSGNHFKHETEIEPTARKRRILTIIAASIILVALTSIAIMSVIQLSPIDMIPGSTEQIFITEMLFPSGGSGTWIYVMANNRGNVQVTIQEVLVGRRLESLTNPTLPTTIQPSSGLGLNITVTGGVATGNTYLVELVSIKGNQFVHVATAGS